MTETDKHIREAMREKMTSEAELARQMGVTRGHVNQIMNGARGKIPQSLLDVLDTLGLELTVREKSDR